MITDHISKGSGKGKNLFLSIPITQLLEVKNAAENIGIKYNMKKKRWLLSLR